MIVLAKKERSAQHENEEADAESREMRRWNAGHFFGISPKYTLFMTKIRPRRDLVLPKWSSWNFEMCRLRGSQEPHTPSGELHNKSPNRGFPEFNQNLESTHSLGCLP